MGFRKPLPKRSFTGGDYAQGYWAGESATPTTIEGSMQPSPGNERKNVPEGYDKTSAHLLITDTQLVAIDRGGQRADQIQYGGEWFTVITRETWQNDVLNHYAYTVALSVNPKLRS